MIEHPRESDRIAEASAVRPSPRQLRWQQLEFAAFVHFGMNTVTDREWGPGHEDPALFDPADLDADSWVEAFRDAGMRTVVLTCKHHDGFALWPTATSRHSVAASPWRGGEGDVVGEVAAACARHGLGFGVYLSPWDRTAPSYGSGRAYDDVFVAQLTELLTGYGPIACVWLDGACGEGPDGRVQTYDWDRYVEVVRRLQPDAVMSICGPDVRWCGNEAGHTRADEWSVVPARLRDAERTAALSQQADDESFAARIPSEGEDLGSRAALLAVDDPLVWYPAEVNTSIRPGWFHHPRHDGAVRSAGELVDVWCRSVGGNATLLLNVPPDRTGRLGATDTAVLRELGERLRALDSADVAAAGSWSFSSAPVEPSSLTSSDPDALPWRPDPAQPQPSITVRWDEPQRLTAVVLREDLRHGQQIEHVRLTATGPDGDGSTVEVGAVGYQRLVRVDLPAVVALTVTVTARRGDLALAGLRALGPTAALD